MDIIVILFFLIVLWRVRPVSDNSGYIGKESTTAIKGIFAIFILFGHTRQYLADGNPGYATNSIIHSRVIYDYVLNLIGQLMVVMFFVYSGYGIMESFKKKKDSYLNGFLKKRVLKTLVHFDIAVAFFLIVALILGHDYSLQEYALCWTGWTSIGNSNWFVFDIIVLYLAVYACITITYKMGGGTNRMITLIFVATFALVIILFFAKKGQTWWYDTVMAFPVGMFWSVYKNKIEKFLSSSSNYCKALSTNLLLFCISYYIGTHHMALFSLLSSMLFATLVILITMRLHIGNPILNWLGVNAFAIYILQRIPMIIVREMGYTDIPALFALIVIPATLMLAAVFTSITLRIDRKIFL